MGYEPKTYRKDGGDTHVIANGGELEVESGGAIEVQSGGEIDIESGGAFKLASTQVTADAGELNTLDLSVVGAASKLKVINMTASDFSDGSEVDTGWDLPANAIVKNVFVNVNTKEDTATTKTINVGTDGSGSDDPDGFLAGVSVATAGLVKGTLDSGGQTLGALLTADEDGSGALVPEADITSGGESVTVTAGDASGFTEADFDIIIEYIEVA